MKLKNIAARAAKRIINDIDTKQEQTICKDVRNLKGYRTILAKYYSDEYVLFAEHLRKQLLLLLLLDEELEGEVTCEGTLVTVKTRPMSKFEKRALLVANSRNEQVYLDGICS